jgi:microcystin-dependent protein
MPRNNNGVYALPQAPFTPGSIISSAAVNSDFSDIASALTGSVASNGSTPITGPIKFVSGQPGAPGITFVSDPTTGLCLPGTGLLGLAADGALGLLVDGTQTGVTDNNISNANGAVLCPVGSIMDWPGAAAPTGWLLLYGQVLSQTTYPGLFAAVGTAYNTGGEGSGNFRLPDCRGRTTVGVDNMGGEAANRITSSGSGIAGTMLGAVGGAQNETLAQANLPNVDFTVSGTTSGYSPTVGSQAALGYPNGVAQITFSGPGSAGFVIDSRNAAAISGFSSLSVTGTTSTGGSDTPVITVPPAIVFNKIIFAGR